MSNHIADANKMVREDVSDEQITAEATPAGELRRQILSPCVAKNEREWWAAGTIEKLEFELNAANDRIKRLEAVVNDPHALWTNWLRGDVKLPAGIGDVRQYQAHIKRLEDCIHRAAVAFFRDGSDGQVASGMLAILEEERGKP